MAGDYSAGGSAADELEAPGAAATETPAGEEQEPKPQGEGIFIPPFPGSENLQPGDQLPLRMVGQTADGQIQVEPMPMGGEGAEPGWKRDLKNSVQTVPGGAGVGNGPEM